MATNPLTHHEILELVEPFARRGLHVDLGLSDRPARRLAFKTVQHAASPSLASTVTEALVLEHLERDRYRLVRTLTHESGLTATLGMEGRSPEILIAQVESVPPARQLLVQDGVLVARNYRIQANPKAKPGAPEAFWPVLRSAEAKLPYLALLFDSQSGFKLPAEIKLMVDPEPPSKHPHGHAIAPPDDLLAVLGWAWKPLRAIKGGWRGSLRLARREPKRTAEAETKLARTVGHLARTLAEPPSRFHPRFYRARWTVMARKIMGIAVVVGALALGPAILMLDLPHDSVLRMLAFNTPPFLLLAVFMVPDMPSMRIPARPRPLPDDAWEPSGEVPVAPGVAQRTAAEIPPTLPALTPKEPQKEPVQKTGRATRMLRSLRSWSRRGRD